MLYHHITQDNRVSLATLKRAGHTHTFIADQLGVHYTTIGRELRRNTTPNKSGYHAATARLQAAERRRVANQRCRKLSFNQPLQRKIERKLRRQWSPEEIAKWVGLSHPTIYDWIYHERSDLKTYLRHRGNTLRRKHGTAARAAWRERRRPRGREHTGDHRL